MNEHRLGFPRRLDRSLRGAGVVMAGLIAVSAYAAKSEGCEGGGFTVLGRSGAQDVNVPAAQVGATFVVQGRYVRFEVDAATLGIRNYAFLPTANPLDMTNGVVTPVFASKSPDHRGLRLTSDLALELGEENIELQREGPGVAMKIQAKDCAAGGVFQMEVERSDQTATEITHVLAGDGISPLSAFYFDNRNFRNREGDVVPYKDTTVVVAARINFGNGISRRFIGRDSPQVATRLVDPSCSNVIQKRPNSTPPSVVVQHCGGVSRWAVASGGRMGLVTGEDAIEVAPPATICVSKCQAQNRVRGQSVKLGFPFPVAEADKLKPRSPTSP
ncbi:hypothetical protein [Variovorax saccharolyticus]|uniref:hypothetical protein n=1 Tax=Variovorax saccharolyticus TaxID=3053516 RepID=UPI002577C246|nr:MULTISPECIES: hypothetical protein [unclassified Variovorax]MDM0019542.1 hypothetical protein [Variovorax sp. J22R187]MDM0029384.1 hypothetical protein [Variovorax sp. J31P216]